MGSEGIRISIDKFGRIVLPKAIRDRWRIKPGGRLGVEERDGVIRLKPVPKKR